MHQERMAPPEAGGRQAATRLRRSKEKSADGRRCISVAARIRNCRIHRTCDANKEQQRLFHPRRHLVVVVKGCAIYSLHPCSGIHFAGFESPGKNIGVRNFATQATTSLKLVGASSIGFLWRKPAHCARFTGLVANSLCQATGEADGMGIRERSNVFRTAEASV